MHICLFCKLIFFFMFIKFLARNSILFPNTSNVVGALCVLHTHRSECICTFHAYFSSIWDRSKRVTSCRVHIHLMRESVQQCIILVFFIYFIQVYCANHMWHLSSLELDKENFYVYEAIELEPNITSRGQQLKPWIRSPCALCTVLLWLWFVAFFTNWVQFSWKASCCHLPYE